MWNSYATIGYIVYIISTLYITIIVGKMFHTHGKWYLYDIFQKEQVIADAINNILLVGYYMLNIAYALLISKRWPLMNSTYEILEHLRMLLSTILLTLGSIHFFNLITLSIIKKLRSKNMLNI